MRKFSNKTKALLWYFIQPIHPFLRDTLLFLRIIHHSGRQPYRIGKLISGKEANDLRRYLIKEKGFEDHFPCWTDDGELASLRLRQNFDWQYHLRIFTDGEVRGHHEYTPESRPIAHLKDTNSTACTAEFMQLLQGWVEKDRN